MRYCSHSGTRYLGWIPILMALWFAEIHPAYAVCYATPTAAIEAIRSGSLSSSISAGDGYRVTGFQSDPLLGHRWAMIANCSHPDWPTFALQLSALDPEGKLSMQNKPQNSDPVVRVGDVVHLWKQEEFLRIEMSAVSEEKGSVGAKIRLRPLHGDSDVNSTQEKFYGIVRGPFDVEMQP